VTGISLGLISLPEFVTGTLLILLFAQWLGWLPAVSLIGITDTVFTHPSILVLPALTLLAASLAQTTRMVRAGMVEVLRSDYIALNVLADLRVVLLVPKRRTAQ